MTNSNSDVSTKVCIKCHQIKPLHAFTQMAGGKFGEHASICYECRNKLTPEQDAEGKGDFRLELKLRLGAEAKIFADKENRQSQQHKEENDVEAHKKNENQQAKTHERKSLLEKKEKSNREVLHSRDFFKSPDSEIKRTNKQVLQQRERQKNISVERHVADNRLTMEAGDDYRIAKEKHKSAPFREYLSSVASGSPLAAAQKISENKNQQKEKDPLIQHIEKNFTRRR